MGAIGCRLSECVASVWDTLYSPLMSDAVVDTTMALLVNVPLLWRLASYPLVAPSSVVAWLLAAALLHPWLWPVFEVTRLHKLAAHETRKALCAKPRWKCLPQLANTLQSFLSGMIRMSYQEARVVRTAVASMVSIMIVTVGMACLRSKHSLCKLRQTIS